MNLRPIGCQTFTLPQEFSGQSYKALMIVICNSRVVMTRKLPMFDARVVIYAREMFKRLATSWPYEHESPLLTTRPGHTYLIGYQITVKRLY